MKEIPKANLTPLLLSESNIKSGENKKMNITIFVSGIIGAVLGLIYVALFTNNNVDPLAGIFWGAVAGLFIGLLI